ncbi:MAG: type II toxin-antitoxin system RelE/ParE family toxin [Mesorhizobium sp.]|nr:type II toxin-antitoxin system RelE/ParE family toxin [Mesorhizobium sp.]RWC32735.1 MAG: type II toxin-antitoxin system RelE/ParE family toxin [Mesorhizobium sp.]TIX24114.1 MAG: type II toxin-antitoxin system RelE/ParE family toxin [Mesorhizobium sp.]
MQVSWTNAALGDLDQIQDFVAQDSSAAAYRLAADLIGRTDELLASNPMIGRKGRASGTRELVISRTPYILVYRVRGGDVEVLAVVHGAREWPKSFT